MSTAFIKPNLYANLATNTETEIKSGSGTLHSVTINTLGTTASVCSVYDGDVATGTLIATIDSLNLSGQFQYDVAFYTSLTIKCTGTPDITVAYT